MLRHYPQQKSCCSQLRKHFRMVLPTTAVFWVGISWIIIRGPEPLPAMISSKTNTISASVPLRHIFHDIKTSTNRTGNLQEVLLTKFMHHVRIGEEVIAVLVPVPNGKIRFQSRAAGTQQYMLMVNASPIKKIMSVLMGQKKINGAFRF